MSKLTVGDFEISLIRDSVYWWDGGTFFGVVPKTLWAPKIPADEQNRIPCAFNCYLIETGEHTILVETGGGDKPDARARERMKLAPEAEPLSEVVARHGYDPDAIDIVVNSHLHWDHCGGNTILTNGSAVPAFPKARYVAVRGEWEHAHERLARDRVSYIDANYDPLVNSGQMMLVEGDYEVAPGLWMRRAPGHNRDMVVITAESCGRTFCFFSDLVPTRHHVRPTWIAAFDLYPLESIETKVGWLDAAAAGDWVCGFSHDSEVAFARITADAKTGFAAVPL
ncbi:MAG: MBL fold metallo-hydrolase [Acidobacteriia bacterium]|nr:MBL fold metallo-hydrolase [Terriglobia bacterium]